MVKEGTFIKGIGLHDEGMVQEPAFVKGTRLRTLSGCIIYYLLFALTSYCIALRA